MILDDPKLSRKQQQARDAENSDAEQREEREGSEDSFPAAGASTVAPPPAYEASAPSSPITPRSPNPIITSPSTSNATSGPSFFPAMSPLPDSPTSPIASPTSPLLQSPYHQQSFQTFPSPVVERPPPPPPSHQPSEYETATYTKAAQRANRRFMRALAIALLIYLVVGTSVEGLIGDLRRRGDGTPSGSYPWGRASAPTTSDGFIHPTHTCPAESFDGEVKTTRMLRVDSDHESDDLSWIIGKTPSPFDIPINLHRTSKIKTLLGINDVDDDVRRGAPYKSAHMSTIPAASLKHFYIVSRGAHANGQIIFVEMNTDKVVVELEYYYWLPSMRPSINLCHLVTNGTSQGFGIYTPNKEWDSLPWFKRDVSFRIVVYLPEKQYLSPSILESDMPNFNHTIKPITHSFESVHFSSTNAAMHGNHESAIVAKKLNITTSNAPIFGNWSVSERLILRTSNAMIDSWATMINTREAHPTVAKITSTNGQLDLRWDLRTIESMPGGYGGAFWVDSSTTNAEVLHSFSSAPLDTSLILNSRTTNAPTLNFLWRSLEGAFISEASRALDTLAITHLKPGDDPKGMGRKAVLRLNEYDTAVVRGSFGWERQDLKLVDDDDDEERNTEEEGSQLRIGSSSGEPEDASGLRWMPPPHLPQKLTPPRFKPPRSTFWFYTTNGRHTISWD